MLKVFGIWCRDKFIDNWWWRIVFVSLFLCVDWWLLCFVILYINVIEGEWKDVIARYVFKWMIEIRKLRVDLEWWSEIFGVFRCEEDSTEDEEIKGLDWLIDWMIDWWIEWMMDWFIDWLMIDWWIYGLIDGFIDCMMDWLIEWWIDWIMDWLI